VPAAGGEAGGFEGKLTDDAVVPAAGRDTEDRVRGEEVVEEDASEKDASEETVEVAPAEGESWITDDGAVLGAGGITESDVSDGGLEVEDDASDGGEKVVDGASVCVGFTSLLSNESAYFSRPWLLSHRRTSSSVKTLLC
jgi:hypothetical protein